MATKETFAQALTAARTAGGWTRREIAEAAGITAQFVAYLEAGQRQPSEDTVDRLVIAMDLAPRAAAQLRKLAAAERPAGR